MEKQSREKEKDRIRHEKAAIRSREKETEKKKREEWQKTTEGRGTMWVQGLHQYIAQAEQESEKLNKGQTALPKNLAKEYSATWSTPRKSQNSIL